MVSFASLQGLHPWPWTLVPIGGLCSRTKWWAWIGEGGSGSMIQASSSCTHFSTMQPHIHTFRAYWPLHTMPLPTQKLSVAKLSSQHKQTLELKVLAFVWCLTSQLKHVGLWKLTKTTYAFGALMSLNCCASELYFWLLFLWEPWKARFVVQLHANHGRIA
jgi:hypothetical protein